MTETAKEFQPVLIWQRKQFRIVKVALEKFVIELAIVDAMGVPAWQHHLNIYDHPGGGATQILWTMLTESKELF
jgi:hypothetical protein